MRSYIKEQEEEGNPEEMNIPNLDVSPRFVE